LNAAGTPVSKHSTAHRDTSTMLRHTSIATHVVGKWREVFLAAGVVSSNFSTTNFRNNFYLFDTYHSSARMAAVVASRIAVACFCVAADLKSCHILDIIAEEVIRKNNNSEEKDIEYT
jgi:hypothetical protein